jgi:hypothetical protein
MFFEEAQLSVDQLLYDFVWLPNTTNMSIPQRMSKN